MNFQMNQAGVFHLRKVANLVKHLTGERYRLSNHGQIAALVKQASGIDSPELQEHLKDFYLQCWPETQHMIEDNQLIPDVHRFVA